MGVGWYATGIKWVEAMDRSRNGGKVFTYKPHYWNNGQNLNINCGLDNRTNVKFSEFDISSVVV